MDQIKVLMTLHAGTYDTVSDTTSSNNIGHKNAVLMADGSTNEARNVERHVCSAYEAEKETTLVERNTAYSSQLSQTNDIEMQSCDAYEVEKKSVIMEHNAAYTALN